jgi:hypothetical protein
MNTSYSLKDRNVIRELSRRCAEIGHLPIQKTRAELWTRHNDLQPGRPLVLVFPEGAWREMLPDTELQCEDRDCRGVERELRTRIYHHEVLKDDNVIEPFYHVYMPVHDTGWGVATQSTRPGQATGAAHYDPVIVTEADLDKIKMPQVTVDWKATEERMAHYQELLGEDGLKVEMQSPNYSGISAMDQFAQWRGLDQLLLDLADRPEWIHEAMRRMCDGMIGCHEALLKANALTLSVKSRYCGSGGNCYTRQLPKPGFDGVHVRSQDLWGFATTQIFSEVSPEMHEEFALKYERRFLSRFGLNAYGCCEGLHHKMKDVKKIANLRRISISPWADVAISAAELGNGYVFSYKPNPAVVAGETWNEDVVRKGIRKVLEQTRGCVVELILKDTHTCRFQPKRMSEWVRIAKEEAEAFG